MALELIIESFTKLFSESLQDPETAKNVFAEGLKEKADEIETLFKASINEATNELKTTLQEKNAEELSKLSGILHEKLEKYVDNAHKEFIKEYLDKLVVESEVNVIKEFYKGIKEVLNEKSIEVDFEQKNQVSQLQNEINEQKAKLNEAIEEKLNLQNAICKKDFELVFEKVSAELADTDKPRFRELCEGFDIDEKLETRMSIVKEKHFTEKVENKIEKVNENKEIDTKKVLKLADDKTQVINKDKSKKNVNHLLFTNK